MSGEALVQLALDALGCTQKELATRMGVSPAQISKWKKGEYMSSGQQDKLRETAGIGDREPDFVLSAGTLDDAQKWERLLRFLADLAAAGAETGYRTPCLENAEEANHLYAQTLRILRQVGVEIPKPFPDALAFDYDGSDDTEEGQAHLDRLFENPQVKFIQAIYKAYADVYGFYAAYVSVLIADLDLYDTQACNIELCLLDLAASKVQEVPGLAVDFRKFKFKVESDYEGWLTHVKSQAFRAGIPLGAELLELVHGSHEALGHKAEAESLGFNASRLHPDIYMNELLVGVRVIHQVLPVIMKKLGIDNDFVLDESELRSH